MRHGRKTKKFSRHRSHREAMFKNLAKNLIINQQIQTTLAKAKEARGLVDKLIALGRQDSLNNRRLAYKYLQNRSLVKRLFVEIAPLFKDRPGGYTRVIRTVTRAGDGAQMAILELVSKIEVEKPKARKTAEGKKTASSREEIKPSKKEKSKPTTKPVEEEALKPKEQKKSIISGLRDYLGGREKNK